MIWPIAYQGDERTGAMLQRAALFDGPEREALAETHGQVSLERAPHRELRARYQPPLARKTDPATSHQAAASVAPGVSALESAILAQASSWQPWSAFALAEAVEREQPGRWDEGTIRSRVSKLGQAGRLVNAPEKVKSPRGHDCEAWLLP